MSLFLHVPAKIFMKGLHHIYQWIKLPYQPNLAPSRTIFGGFDIIYPPYNAMAFFQGICL